jgi:hypothetical protein
MLHGDEVGKSRLELGALGRDKMYRDMGLRERHEKEYQSHHD